MKSTLKNFVLALFMATLAITTAHALPANGTLVNAAKITLQGGNNSSVQWSSPVVSTDKVWVQIPAGSTATNALYRIYLKGNSATNTVCSNTDVTYPCFEVTVNQAANQGKWVLLAQTSGTVVKDQWKFAKGGFVSVNASNVIATEQIGVAAVSFESMLSALAIGQKYQGGIIFYLDSTKLHGLVAAPKDIVDSAGQSLAVQWYNGSYTITNATGTAIGTGKANTAAIIASQGAGVYAAKLCDDLVVGIYKDWYLPSKDELNLMYTNIGQGVTNGGGFASNNYWSSTEHDNYNAWDHYFYAGNQGTSHKGNVLYARAVRTF